MKLGTTSIGVRDPERLVGRAPERLRHRGHRVALHDAEARGLEVAGVVADQRDVGAVERGDHLERLRRQDLARQDRGDRVGHRVVDVQEVEAVLARHLDHLGGERQLVGRVLEQRVLRHHHLVEEEARARPGPAATAARS